MMWSKKQSNVMGRHFLLVVMCVTVYHARGHGRDSSWCLPRDCRDIQELGFTTSGLYHVTPYRTVSGFDVWCDLETEGGGWLVFQRRHDGTEDFYRNWTEYQRGFGDPQAEHWLGNLALHAITSQGFYELRIELEDLDGDTAFAQYDYFKLGSHEDNYRLIVSGYSGNAGDSLGYHDGRVFDTYDTGSSVTSNGNKCTDICRGGWWYGSCFKSNLNGDYHLNGTGRAVSWTTFKGLYVSLKRTEMKLSRR